MKDSRARVWRDLGYSRRQKSALGQAATKRRLGLEALEDRRVLTAVLPVEYQFESLPGAPVDLYLHFGGIPAIDFVGPSQTYRADGPGDVNNPTTALSMDDSLDAFSVDELLRIEGIYKHVAEKFSPFNINVRTLPPASQNHGETASVVVGGLRTDWLNRDVSGISALNGFTNSSQSNFAFVFSNNYNDLGFYRYIDFIGETIAHEAGHMFGLSHQSEVRVNADGETVVVDQYSDGVPGIEVPIMGASNGDFLGRGVWQTGPASRLLTDGTVEFIGYQNDLATLTRPGNHIAYRADDNAGAPVELAMDPSGELGVTHGVIESGFDSDAFDFRAISTLATLIVKNAPFGGMLNPSAALYDSVTGSPASYTAAWTNTSVQLTATNLIPGRDYILYVRSESVVALGQYTIEGSLGTIATLEGGVLTVRGFAGLDNNLRISYNAATERYDVFDSLPQLGVSAFAQQTFDAAAVAQIRVNLIGNNDTVDVQLLRETPVRVFGNDGIDKLIVNDFVFANTGPDAALIYDDRIERSKGSFPDNTFYTVHYADMDNIEYRGAGNTSNYRVHETAPLPAGFETSIRMSNLSDTIRVYPRDAAGNAAILGNLRIRGVGGANTLYIDDFDSTSGATWTIGNPAGDDGTQIFTVGGGATIAANLDVQQVVLRGSQGPDTFNLTSYKNGSGLRVEGNDGYDTLNLTPTSGDLAANITSMASFHYDGGTGHNVFNVDNSTNNNRWTYTRTAAYLRTSLDGSTYFGVWNHANVQQLQVFGGPQPDQLFVHSAAAGSLTELYGGGGVDQYLLAPDPDLLGASLQNLRGGVHAYGDGGDVFSIVSNDATGRTVHVGTTQVGHAPGDNLFGPGGYLEFFGRGLVLSLITGGGADTVYAVPNPTTPLDLDGTAPTSTPGDKLELLLAGVANPTYIAPAPGGPAFYVFGNAAYVAFRGFEEVTTVTAGADFNGDGAVNAVDLGNWKGGFGVVAGAARGQGDADADGDVDGNDFLAWQRHVGAGMAGTAATPSARLGEEVAELTLIPMTTAVADLAPLAPKDLLPHVASELKVAPESTTEATVSRSAVLLVDLASTVSASSGAIARPPHCRGSFEAIDRVLSAFGAPATTRDDHRWPLGGSAAKFWTSGRLRKFNAQPTRTAAFDAEPLTNPPYSNRLLGIGREGARLR